MVQRVTEILKNLRFADEDVSEMETRISDGLSGVSEQVTFDTSDAKGAPEVDLAIGVHCVK